MPRLLPLALFAVLACKPSSTPPGSEPTKDRVTTERATATPPADYTVPPDPSDAYPIVDLSYEISSPEWSAAHPRREPSDAAKLRVVVVRQPKLEDHLVDAFGYLVNDSSAPVELETSGMYLWLTFAPDAHIQERPIGSMGTSAPPPPPPPPSHATLPARSRTKLQGRFSLDPYFYPPGKPVDVVWRFLGIYGAKWSGVWRGITMPQDGPRGEILPSPPG